MPNNGQMLYECIREGFRLPKKEWALITENERTDYHKTAELFVKSLGPILLPDEGGRVFDIVNYRWLYTMATEEWKPLLERYGRHHPSCSTGAECTCGFAEVEKRLKA